jgi:hypothetical protein
MEKELSDYIFKYCKKIFSEEEKKANKLASGLSKMTKEELLRIEKFGKLQFNASDEKSNQLLSNGIDNFIKKVTLRIFEEHKDELIINRCPKCSKVARTPTAKQCRFCNYDWHN